MNFQEVNVLQERVVPHASPPPGLITFAGYQQPCIHDILATLSNPESEFTPEFLRKNPYFRWYESKLTESTVRIPSLLSLSL